MKSFEAETKEYPELIRIGSWDRLIASEIDAATRGNAALKSVTSQNGFALKVSSRALRKIVIDANGYMARKMLDCSAVFEDVLARRGKQPSDNDIKDKGFFAATLNALRDFLIKNPGESIAPWMIGTTANLSVEDAALLRAIVSRSVMQEIWNAPARAISVRTGGGLECEPTRPVGSAIPAGASAQQHKL